MKHTPGPWENAGDGTIVTGKVCVATVGQAWTDNGEPEANARLIAAAPDMLAMLKGTAQWLEDNHLESNYGLDDWTLLNEVIYLAEGR